MATTTVKQIKEFCRKGKYKNESKVIEDLQHVFGTYTHLKVCTDTYTYDDGSQKILLNLFGTVAVCYLGSNYNIPIRIWLQRTHPEDGPICYVEPTTGMYVEPSQYVNGEGRIYLPYLNQWSHPAFHTLGLISVISTAFSEKMPVYAKSGTTSQTINTQPTRRGSSISISSTGSSDYMYMGHGSSVGLDGPYVSHAESCKQLIHKAVSKYKNKDCVKRDVLETLAHYKSLKPEMNDWEDEDGKIKKTLNVSGTVPIDYQGASYNIPVCVWILKDYPQRAPVCFLRPTRGMAIKACSYVDPSGKIQLQYLQNWKHPNTDLHGVIQVMAVEFSKDCPIYSVTSTPQQSNTSVYQPATQSLYHSPAQYEGNDPSYMPMNPVRRVSSTSSTSSSSSQPTYMPLNAREVSPLDDYQSLTTVTPEVNQTSYYNLAMPVERNQAPLAQNPRVMSNRPLPPIPDEHGVLQRQSPIPQRHPQGAIAMHHHSPLIARQPDTMQQCPQTVQMPRHRESDAGSVNIDRTRMLELQLANAQRELEVMKLKEKTRELEEAQVCSICMENRKDTAFQCGHMTCKDCADVLHNCPICRQPIERKINLFQG
ncbi:uncharacterized protein LOC144452815 [Glandiceps talaboti]